MVKNIYIYVNAPVDLLESLIETFRDDFDSFLEESFSPDELNYFEPKIDELAALYVQPILSELSFDDFYPDPKFEEEQRLFFASCRSSIALENLPFLETNPFQITYLRMLMDVFPEALLDLGGVSELCFKNDFLNMLKTYKSIDVMAEPVKERPVDVKTTRPVDPIDFLILDVYKEFERLKDKNLDWRELSEKVQKIFQVMRVEKLDSTQLVRAVGLNPKDFDDGLERLKFWLRKH